MKDLNIRSNVKRLVLEALNNHGTEKDAAMALGVTWKTLYNYKRDFNIIKFRNKYTTNAVLRTN